MNLCPIPCWNKPLALGNYATVPKLPSCWTIHSDSISVTRLSLSGWFFFVAQPYKKAHWFQSHSPSTFPASFLSHKPQPFTSDKYIITPNTAKFANSLYLGVLDIISFFICYSNITDSVMRKTPIKNDDESDTSIFFLKHLHNI